MEAIDLLEIVTDLGVLKGFPRNDASAVLAVAEALLRCFSPGTPVPEVKAKAKRIVRHVIDTAPSGWEGPAQFRTAQHVIAGESQEWHQPAYWDATAVICAECTDTGAVYGRDRFFVACSCNAGATAGKHIRQMNESIAALLRHRTAARDAIAQQRKVDHAKLAENLSMIEKVDS